MLKRDSLEERHLQMLLTLNNKKVPFLCILWGGGPFRHTSTEVSSINVL